MLHSEDDPTLSALLHDYQMEATWRLADWDQLNTQIKSQPVMDTTRTWGSSMAALMCDVKQRDSDALRSRLDRARDDVMDALTTLTLEESDTYAQAYKYILRHVVY